VNFRIPVLVSALIILLSHTLSAQNEPSSKGINYQEIPDVLKKLEATQLEGERIQYNKIIHDAIVHADLINKHVVKKMIPIIKEIQVAIDSGLDRLNISGQAYWLASAINYFDQEKLQKKIEIPPSDWMSNQKETSLDQKISVFPDKIILYEGKKSTPVFVGSHIHEAIISPDGKWVAFFKLIDPALKDAEIYSLDLKKKNLRKLAHVSSCYTLLFSLDGKTIFFQEARTSPEKESGIFRVKTKGGRVQPLGHARVLQTIVEKGPHKGNLILYRNFLHHLGVSRLECPVAITPSGKELGKLPENLCR